MTIQFVSTEGNAELVVMNRDDYDKLLARAGDSEAEERVGRAIIDRTKAAIDAGREIVLPGWFAELLIEHGNIYKGLREFRRRTQQDIASEAGISQGYLSDLERGLRVPSLDVVDAIARTFQVEPKWLHALERNRVTR